MDDALVRIRKLHSFGSYTVLILVVMDDALVHYIRLALTLDKPIKVLILVVMDDALVQTKISSISKAF